jgi:glutaminase
MQLQCSLLEILADVEEHLGRGRVASYIPALARVDPSKLGVAVITLDGEVATAGDARESFSMQSVSKVFMLALALSKLG